MLISKRRSRWLIVLLLSACCVLLFRPLRSRVDNLIVGSLLHPNLSVQALIFHSDKSIVEARDLSWDAVVDACSFGFTARRGWLAVDKLGLIDRHIRFPKIIVQDAHLYLTERRQRPRMEVDPWKQHVAAQIAQLDWEQIKQRCDSLLTTQNMTSTWSSRMDSWVARSREIVAQARQLEDEASALENPLRFEDLVREKLERLNELSTEQRLLGSQFDGMENLLKIEKQRVFELQQSDLERLAELGSSGAASEKLSQWQDALGRELALDFAQEAWSRIASQAEIVARLGEATSTRQTAPYDVDIRVKRGESLTLLDCGELKVAGVFQCGRERIPFEAIGHAVCSQDGSFAHQHIFDCQYTFHANDSATQVMTTYDSHDSRAIQIQISVVPVQLEALDSRATQGESTTTAVAENSTEAVLTSWQGRLDGKLSLSRASLSHFARPSADCLPQLSASSQLPQERLSFRMAGNWRTPQFELTSAVPDWLQSSIETALERELCAATSAAREQINAELDRELQRLERLVDTAVKQGRSLTEAHRRQLLASHARLQEHLDKMIGGEFARRPGAINR